MSDIDSLILRLQDLLAALKTHAELDKVKYDEVAELQRQLAFEKETADRRAEMLKEKNSIIETLNARIAELEGNGEPIEEEPLPDLELVIATTRQGEQVTGPQRAVYPWVKDREDILRVQFYLNGEPLCSVENYAPWEACGAREAISIFGEQNEIGAVVYLKNGSAVTLTQQVKGYTGHAVEGGHASNLLKSLQNHSEVNLWLKDAHQIARIFWGQFLAPAYLGAKLTENPAYVEPVKKAMTQLRGGNFPAKVQAWDKIMATGTVSHYILLCDLFPEYHGERDYWLEWILKTYIPHHGISVPSGHYLIKLPIYNEAHTTAAVDLTAFTLGRIGKLSDYATSFKSQLHKWFNLKIIPGNSKVCGGFHFYEDEVTVPYGALYGGYTGSGWEDREKRFDRKKAADWTYARVLPDVFITYGLEGVSVPEWKPAFVNSIKRNLLLNQGVKALGARDSKLPGVGMSGPGAPFPNGDFRSGISVDQMVSSGLAYMLCWDETEELERVMSQAHAIVKPHVDRPAYHAAMMLKDYVRATS